VGASPVRRLVDQNHALGYRVVKSKWEESNEKLLYRPAGTTLTILSGLLGQCSNIIV
jgi:hypothetical protein